MNYASKREDSCGTLYRQKVIGSEDLVKVEFRLNGHTYLIRVPPKIQTPEEAIQWAFPSDWLI